MLDGRTDLAVHSAKDMPTEVPEGLAIVAFTAREDVRDVFVGRARRPRRALSTTFRRGAVVGTSSLRRRSQLLALRPDLDLVDIRGNVQTRLRKLEEQGMAGTILAAAGLARLGAARAGVVRLRLRPDAARRRAGLRWPSRRSAGDARVAALVAPLDPRAHRAGRARRAQPHARPRGRLPGADRGLRRGRRGAGRAGVDQLLLRAFVGSVDGTTAVRGELAGPAQAPEGLGDGARRRPPGARRRPRSSPEVRGVA